MCSVRQQLFARIQIKSSALVFAPLRLAALAFAPRTPTRCRPTRSPDDRKDLNVLPMCVPEVLPMCVPGTHPNPLPRGEGECSPAPGAVTVR
jgi:hypothetical protein